MPITNLSPETREKIDDFNLGNMDKIKVYWVSY
jgi:hypothetical protein